MWIAEHVSLLFVFNFAERPQSPPKDDSKTKTKNRSYLCCCLQVAGFILLLPVVLYMTLSLLSSANPTIGLYIGQATADLQYPLQRVIRFMSLPFHHIYDLSKFSSWECMVNNPLYTPGNNSELCCSGTLLPLTSYVCSWVTRKSKFLVKIICWVA